MYKGLYIYTLKYINDTQIQIFILFIDYFDIIYFLMVNNFS